MNRLICFIVKHTWRTRMILSDLYEDTAWYVTKCDYCGAVKGDVVEVKNRRGE